MSDPSECGRGPLPDSNDAQVPELEPNVTAGSEPSHSTEQGTPPAPDGAGGRPESARRNSLWADAWRTLRRDPIFVISALLILLFLAMALFPQLFTDVDPVRGADLSRSAERPSSEHWFGFDIQGRDYFARVIYGARVSMIVGTATVFGASLAALIIGSLAGWYGGLIDALLSRFTDVWFALPTVLGAIVILSVVEQRGVWQVAGVLVLLSWPTMMRITRSTVLSEREREYVQAARALGAGDARIIIRHILPNAIAPVIVYATIAIGVTIAAEATLSFLGVGLQLPAVSWGLMISLAQSRVLNTPHLLLFPGVFLSIMVFSFILLGDSLRDALDPRLR